MPEQGFGAGMYEEEDNAQHESGEIATSRAFARAQNPTARDVTPALGCDPEINHHDFMDDGMEEEDSSQVLVVVHMERDLVCVNHE